MDKIKKEKNDFVKSYHFFFFFVFLSPGHENACLSPTNNAAPAATVVMAMAPCQKDGESVLPSLLVESD